MHLRFAMHQECCKSGTYLSMWLCAAAVIRVHVGVLLSSATRKTNRECRSRRQNVLIWRKLCVVLLIWSVGNCLQVAWVVYQPFYIHVKFILTASKQGWKKNVCHTNCIYTGWCFNATRFQTDDIWWTPLLFTSKHLFTRYWWTHFILTLSLNSYLTPTFLLT